MYTNKILLALCFCLISSFSFAQLHLDNNGNVSVGTTASAGNVALKVVGNATFNSTVGRINSGALIMGHNNYTTALTPDYTWYYNDRTGFFHPAVNRIGVSTAGLQRILVDELGRLTFDNSSTGAYGNIVTAKLNHDLSKTWIVSRGGSHKFWVYGNGNTWSTGNFTFSDKRLKSNIAPLESSMEKLLKLEGVSYIYKDAVGKDKPAQQIGLIAQDVQKVVPEAVAENGDGYLGIDYVKLIPLLIESIKEQHEEIESLKALLDDKSLNETGSINAARLYQNAPNPFDNETTIGYFLPDGVTGSLVITDFNGQLLKEYSLTSGEGNQKVDGNQFHAGIFLYSLVVNNEIVDTKKMILSK